MFRQRKGSYVAMLKVITARVEVIKNVIMILAVAIARKCS